MTIKGAYIAHAERHGDLVAIRLKGDETCLWLDMYLDLAIHIGADSAGIDLPEEWWECLTAGYTPRQRYFARMCSEVIALELRRMMEEDGINGD